MNDYLSIKEFSICAGVSKQAIYKQLETRLKPYTKIENGKKFISKTALELFNQSQPSSQPESQPIQPENQLIQPENQPIQPESQPESQPIQPSSQPSSQPENQSNNEIFLEIIKTIQEELEKKNKQLEEKDKQIENLSERLAEALQLVRGQQVLHASEKAERAIETKQETKIEPKQSKSISRPLKPTQKKNIFRRLFR